MTHIYFGDPNEDFSLNLAQTLLDNGADILEIGIPYTDPVCDGEVFQSTCRRALEEGITPRHVLNGISSIRKLGYKQKIYLTSYYGPIFKMGITEFVSMAEYAGVDGFIVPDLLLEEQGELRKACNDSGISLIQFATVYSSLERLKTICYAAGDFIYCISLPGVTGERGDFYKLIKLIKSITQKKIFVGFGIKSPEDAKEIMKFGADGVIVGSAIAKMYDKNIQHPDITLSVIAAFIKSLKESTI